MARSRARLSKSKLYFLVPGWWLSRGLPVVSRQRRQGRLQHFFASFFRGFIKQSGANLGRAWRPVWITATKWKYTFHLFKALPTDSRQSQNPDVISWQKLVTQRGVRHIGVQAVVDFLWVWAGIKAADFCTLKPPSTPTSTIMTFWSFASWKFISSLFGWKFAALIG